MKIITGKFRTHSVFRLFLVLLFISGLSTIHAQRNRYSMVLSGMEGAYSLRDADQICNLVDCENLPADVYERYVYEEDLVTARDLSYCTTIKTIYKEYDSHTLAMEIDIPTEFEGSHPFIIYVHGGGWSSGGVTTYNDLSKYLASRGIAGVRITYTLTGQGGTFNMGMQELEDAYLFILDHADEWGLDVDNYGYVAGSAGTPLAALKAMQHPSCKLFVGFYGLYDFQHNLDGNFGKTSNYLTEYPASSDRDVISAINHIPDNHIPVVRLFHGTADYTISYLQSKVFRDSLISKGGDAYLYQYDFYSHSFFNKGFSDIYESSMLEVYVVAKELFGVDDLIFNPDEPNNLTLYHNMQDSMEAEIASALSELGKEAHQIVDTLFIKGAAFLSLQDCKAIHASGMAATTIDLSEAEFLHDSIPAAVGSDDGAFAANNILKTVVFPPNLKIVGRKAFRGCSGLTTAYLPKTVEKIYSYAFVNCALLEMDVFPSSLVYLGDAAFSKCSNVTFATLPDSLVVLGDNTESTGQGVFRYCTNIGISEIPQHVLEIGQFAFSDCPQLTRFTFPGGLEYIGNGSFSDCSGLTDLYFKGEEPPVAVTTGFPTFRNLTLSAITAHVPEYSETKYLAVSPWNAMNIVGDYVDSFPFVSNEKIFVSVHDGTVIIHHSSEQDYFSVYTITGQLYQKDRCQEKQTVFEISENGIYVIKVNHISKLIVL